jgi:hypothetical protein
LANEKERKKALKREARRQRREQEAAEWERHMMLEPDQLKALLDYLDERLGRRTCDHSLRLTRAWGERAGVDWAALERSVLHFGGGCDCEVLANVDPETRFETWPRYLEHVRGDG